MFPFSVLVYDIFLVARGSAFAVSAEANPTIGGKELDLHQLFLEVTSRGGIEKIIRERRWKETTAGFKFPSTATNAYCVLRQHYQSIASIGSHSKCAAVFAVSRVIDGKFESGYLVTVKVGSKKLKGVLYQAPQNLVLPTMPQHSSVTFQSIVLLPHLLLWVSIVTDARNVR
ncbi:hypothetical protein K1719_014109 [Acacia pycnantha]|nr:hypothetical protein K1719_014109 [Acacia pycnantha]